LQVDSNVPGARVVVRDRPVGQTPLLPVAVAAGPAHVEVFFEGYGPWSRDLDLKAGIPTVLNAVLALRVDTGLLRVHAATAGTLLTIDRRPIGGSPAELVVSPGAHTIVAHAEGLDDHQTTVVVAPGMTKDVDVEPTHRPPITARWWFWTAAGLTAAAGVALTAALLSSRPADTGMSFTPPRVSGP
jgi:hypothetical protein